jgi:hypothetical protein
MNTQNTQRLQPQTLNALNEFLTIWNQDPLATNHSLVLTGNQVSVMNETNVFLTITIPTETETSNQTVENEPDIFESLFPSIDLDELLETEETAMLPQQEKENLNEETLEEFPLQESDYEESQSPSNDLLTKFIDDLTKDTEEIFIRINPLIETTFKEKLKEIISRLKEETRGKQRDQVLKTLEACYYLGQLRESIKENRQRLKYTRNTLKKSLNPRRADRIWKCSERVYQIFQICGLPRLCSTTKITFTNLEELSDEDFTELLESVRIRSAHF